MIMQENPGKPDLEELNLSLRLCISRADASKMRTNWVVTQFAKAENIKDAAAKRYVSRLNENLKIYLSETEKGAVNDDVTLHRRRISILLDIIGGVSEDLSNQAHKIAAKIKTFDRMFVDPYPPERQMNFSPLLQYRLDQLDEPDER